MIQTLVILFVTLFMATMIWSLQNCLLMALALWLFAIFCLFNWNKIDKRYESLLEEQSDEKRK